MKISLAGATVLAGMAGAAMGQTTGVSHPEQVPMTVPTEEMQQPGVVYDAPVAAKPSAALKMRSAEPEPTRERTAEIAPRETRPVVREGGVDGMIVGDDVSGLVPAETDANIVTRIAGPSNQLPVGTMVKVRMAESLSTKGTVEGTQFTAQLTEPVLRDGRVLLCLVGCAVELGDAHDDQLPQGARQRALMADRGKVAQPAFGDGAAVEQHGIKVEDAAALPGNPLDQVPYLGGGRVYRPRFLRHRFRPYAARAAVGSCSERTAAGGRKPCRSMSQVAL